MNMLSFEPSEVSSQKQELYQRLRTGAGPVYLPGRNKDAQQIARVWVVRVFVDDFTRERIYSGKPVIRGFSDRK